MGYPSPRQGLANPRTGNPTPHPGYPRPNKWEHQVPNREPIRRNSGSLPTGAGANHYRDYRAPGASSKDARPPPARSRLPHPSRPILSPVLAGRRVPHSAPSEQAPQPAPFPERACLSLSASELRRRAKTVQRGPLIRSATRLSPVAAQFGYRKRWPPLGVVSGCLRLVIRATAPLSDAA
jgi:hypothetical protein